MTATLFQLLLSGLAGLVAGAVNAIAGGGTLVTFPTLVAIGIPPIIANATSSVALWPGTLASMWGYRRVLAGAKPWAMRFAIPSLAGGGAGAWLLLRTSEERFETIAPLLVLLATVLFMAQGPLGRWLRGRRADSPPTETAGADPRPKGASGASGSMTAHVAGGGAAPAAEAPLTPEPAPEEIALRPPQPPLLGYQALVAVYGGYFGAGMGILMLAALGLMGLRNIHQMNGLKNWGAACINLVAVAIFAASGIVNWPVAGVVAVGATLGGYAGSRVAQRVEQRTVRRAIIAIGLGSAVWLTIG